MQTHIRSKTRQIPWMHPVHFVDDDANVAKKTLSQGVGREWSAADLAAQAMDPSATADLSVDGKTSVPAGIEATSAADLGPQAASPSVTTNADLFADGQTSGPAADRVPEAMGQLPRSASTLTEAGSISKLSPIQPPPGADGPTGSGWPGEITSSSEITSSRVAAEPYSPDATAPVTTRDNGDMESPSIFGPPATPQGQLQNSFSTAAIAGSVTSQSASPVPPLQGGLGRSSLQSLQGGEDVGHDAAEQQMPEGGTDSVAPAARRHADNAPEGGLPSAAAVTASVAAVSDWQPDSSTSSLPLSTPFGGPQAMGVPQAMGALLQSRDDIFAGNEAGPVPFQPQGEPPAFSAGSNVVILFLYWPLPDTIDLRQVNIRGYVIGIVVLCPLLTDR